MDRRSAFQASHVAQLDQENRGLQFIEPTVPADHLWDILRLPTVVPKFSDFACHCDVVRHHHAPVTIATEILGREKAEAARIPERPGLPSPVLAVAILRAKRLRVVLDDFQVMSIRQAEDERKVSGTAIEVNRNDGPCARGDLCFQAAGIQSVGLGVNVRKNRRSSGLGHSLGRGEKSVRRNDHFVTGTNAAGPQRQPERIGPGGQAHGVLDAQVSGNRFLKALHSAAEDEGAAGQNVPDRVVQLLADVLILQRQVNQWNRHSRTYPAQNYRGNYQLSN